MKLRINAKLRAALIAAVSVVGFTLTQAQAVDVVQLTSTFNVPSDQTTAWTVTDTSSVDLSTSNWTLVKATDGSTVVNSRSGAAGQLRPNTNVQNVSGWILSFDITNGGAETQKLNAVSLDSFLFNSSNAYQGNGTDRKFQVTLTYGDPSQSVNTGEFTIHGKGDAHPDNGVVNLAFTEAVTLGSSQTLHVSVKFDKATETSGCFVGLNGISLLSSVETVTATWQGTEEHHAWSEPEAWDTPFTPHSSAVFTAAAAHKTVTVDQDVVASSVTVQDAAYTFEMAGHTMTTDELNVTGNTSSLSVTGAGAVLNVAQLNQEGTLDIGAGAAVNLSATEYTVGSGKTFKTTGDGLLTLTTLKVAGGTLDIASDLKVTGGGDGKGGNNSKGLHLSGDGATVNINDGTTTVTGAIYTNANNISLNVGTGATDAKLVTRRLEIGDRNGGAATFHVGQHGTVVITGNEDYRQDTNNPQKNTSLQLAEWNQIVSINIEGNLYSKDATAFMSNDASSSIAINGGTMAVKGIANSSSDSNRAHTLTMTGGKIVLGERGLAAEPGNWTVTLNSGEIGMYTDTTVVGRNADIAGTVTFNTAKYTWSGTADTLALNEGVEGGTMTVSANLTGAGTIVKKGAGTLELSGTANALSHAIEVQAGELVLSGTYAIDDIALDAGGSILYYNHKGELADSGFRNEAGTKTVYTLAGDATVNKEGATFTEGGHEIQLTENKYVIEGVTNYTTVWANGADTVDYDAYYAASGDETKALTTASVADGATLAIGTQAVGTLQYQTDGATAKVSGTGTVNTLSGTGKLALAENAQVSLGAINGTSTFSLADGSVLQIAFSGLPTTLTAEGTGTLRLLKGADQNTNLSHISAPTLKLAADDTHNSRFVYNNSSSLSGVQNLYFDGAQLWLNSGNSALNFAGTVTFGTENHYSESANLDSAMRVNSSAKFTGAVAVEKDAKITWQANNQYIEFAGDVTGSGNLTLATYNSGAQNGSRFIISGDASKYAGAIKSLHSSITLEVAQGGTLMLGEGSSLAGAVSLNGGKIVAAADALTIGTLNITAGELEVASGITTLGTVTKTGEGAATFTGEGTAKLNSVIALQGGTLTMSGTYNIDALTGQITVTDYVDGAVKGNGFAVESGTVTVVDVAQEAQLVTTGGVFLRGGSEATMEGGVATVDTTNRSTFYVNIETENLTTAQAISPDAAVVLADGAKLVADANLTAGLSVAEGGHAYLQIEEGKLVQATVDAAVELSGSGTYALVSGVSTMGSTTLGEDWTGAIRLGGFSFSNTSLASFWREGSVVEMCGITGGYLEGWNNGAPVAANIRLTNPAEGNDGIAWKWNEGTTGKTEPTVTFTGDWDGSGTFQLTYRRQNVTFAGDISGWEGVFDYAGSYGTRLTFKADADEINATILNNGTNNPEDVQQQFHIIVENAATFNKSVSAYTLEVVDGASATFNAAVAITTSITVGEDATLNMAAGGSIAEAITSAGTVSLTGVTLSDDFVAEYGGFAHYDVTGALAPELTNYYGGTDGKYLTVVTGTGAANATGSGLVWGVKDNLAMNNGLVKVEDGGVIDYSAFYVTESTTTAEILAYAGEHADELGWIVVDSGTLTLSEPLSDINLMVSSNAAIAGAVTQEQMEGTLIGQGATATFGGVTELAPGTGNDHVTISSATTQKVAITNIGETDEIITYEGLAQDSAKVTADAVVVEAEREADVTIANALEVQSITNNSEHTLYLDGEVVTEALDAAAGDITLRNVAESVEVGSLTIGDHVAVGAYQGTEEEAAQEATVVISQTLTAGEESVLHANLELKDGATLNFNGTLTMTSELTVGTNLMLDETSSLYQELASFAEGSGRWVDLIMAGDDYALSYGTQGLSGANAADFFANGLFESGDYMIFATEESFGITRVPEPTTGTLSLLALMALATRRRRH